MGGSGGEHGGATRYDAAERAREIVALRRKRFTFQAIADQVGMSVSGVHDAYRRACAEIPKAEVELHRQEMLDQLDQAEQAVLAVLEAVHVTVSQGHIVHHIDGVDDDGKPILGDPVVDDSPILDAARTLVALQARKAKLLGADAPTQVEATAQVRYEVVGVEPGDVA